MRPSKFSKRVDEQLRVHIKSSHHTTRDADKDTTKMASYLVEENAESEDLSRTGTTFVDPIKKGADKITSGYIDKYLNMMIVMKKNQILYWVVMKFLILNMNYITQTNIHVPSCSLFIV